MSKLRAPLPLRDVSPRLVDNAWREVRARRDRARDRVDTRRVGAALAFAAAAAIVIFVWLGRRAPSDSLAAFVVGTRAELATEGAPVRRVFADRSWLELVPIAQATVTLPDAAHVHVALAQGKVALHVEPNGPRSWTIDAGPTSVIVVGTDLSVDREPTRTVVTVTHGVVEVRGPAAFGTRRVAAGERVIVDDALAPAVVEPPQDRAVPIDTLPSAPIASAPIASGSPSVPSSVPRDKRSNEVAALLELADAARASNHPERAVEPLERVVRLHANDPLAPVAAFTLGKLELDTLHRPARAAQAFADCLRLGPPQSLAEDAYARRVEALEKSGDEAGARETARAYRKRYPEGRHLSKLARWMGD